MVHVRFAARDPGGANALAGFLSRRPTNLPFTFDVWTLPRATRVFEEIGVKTREFSEDVDFVTLRLNWSEKPADALITGTSHYASFEALLWHIARTHRCPSLAINDSWANLGRRFTDGRPDYVGAIDEEQVGILVDLGFPRNEIVIVGHPWLSPLLANRQQILRTTEVPQDDADVRVLFVSECIANDVKLSFNAAYGFDEFDSFVVLHRAAATAVRMGTRVSLAVKFHPYEEPASFVKHVARLESLEGLNIRFLKNNDPPYPWVLWSDLVVGIGSMLLLEAIVLGRPVVSVQPGLVRENTFIAGTLGYAETLIDARQGQKILTNLMQSRAARKAELERNQPFVKRITEDSFSPIMNWINAEIPGQ